MACSTSITFSRSAKQVMNMVLKPMSLAAMPAQSTCECRRSSSAITTRMYLARGGASRPASFSMAWQRVSVWMNEQMPQTRSMSAITWIVVARLGQMLDAAEVEADVQLGVLHRLAFADHVELVGFFKAGMVGPHGNFVAHFATSSCPCAPEAGLRRPASRAGSRPACRPCAAAAARTRGR